MRHYQQKKGNPYLLPHNLYMRVLYLVRDYERLVAEKLNIIHAQPCFDGQPKGNRISDPILEKVTRLEMLSRECSAVEKAMEQVPKEYIVGILNNVCKGSGFPIDAGSATYSRWRCRFIYYIAENLDLI